MIVDAYLAGRPTERAAYAVKALRQHFAGAVVQDLTAADIADYKASRAGAAPSTVHKELATFRAALRYCQHELGWDVPADLLKGRMPQLRERGVRWLTRDEYDALMQAAARNPRAAWLPDFIALAVRTGLRHRELLGLTWARVDFDNCLIYLGPADQKGARSSSVPLNPTAVEILTRRRDANAAKPANKRSDFVIYRTGGARIYNARKSFQNAVSAAEIPDLRIHDLRHTCAAWLIQNGVPLRTVAEIMRHQDISTTMIYAHLAPDAVRQAVEALG